jgi:hypothetical protein
VTSTLQAFTGTLLTTMAQIKSIGGIANGGTQELFVQCASGLGGTGNIKNDMDIFVTYSADGSTYTTSSAPPSGAGASPTPSGSSGAAGSGSTSSPGATPSVGSGTSAGSGNPSPTPRPSVAPSPSALASSFAVTG